MEINLLIADDHSLNRAKTIINPPTQNSICGELNPEPSRDVNTGPFDTDSINHVIDISGEKCERLIKVPSPEDEKAVRSLFNVNNLQRCRLAHQKGLEDKPASMVHRFNQKETTITRTGLNPELQAKARETGQSCAVIKQNRSDAFENCNRRVTVHVRS